MHQAAGGVVASENYAKLLRALAPGAAVDVCYPADSGSALPDAMALDGYDGIAITGSALNIYAGGPAIEGQIALARAALGSGTPVFGSCWGLQVLTVAAGGSVRRNPKGREIGFAREITLTQAGRAHRMYAGKPEMFDALTVHLDEVETLAPGMTVLARNAVSEVQAAEIKAGRMLAWGVQYHPEYPPAEMAAILRRYGSRLVDEKLFDGEESLRACAGAFQTLEREPSNADAAARLGIAPSILALPFRSREIANWLTAEVFFTRSRRGRG